MNWNTQRDKGTITLNQAGDEAENPILEGLPFVLKTRFNREVKQVQGYVGTESPPTTLVNLTQDADPYLWKYNGVAGNTLFPVGKNYFRAEFTSQDTNDKTVWEREIYIAGLPSNAIQVWDVVEGWISINFDTSPTVIPTVCQMCAVRFFPEWFDEFETKHFGGVEKVSIYDWGTLENETSEDEVRRDLSKDITRVEHLYCHKDLVATQEPHEFVVAFKNINGVVAQSVHCKVNTVACIGYNIKDPQVTS